MRSCSSDWKDEEARGFVSQAPLRCRYRPRKDFKRAVHHWLSCRLFSSQKRSWGWKQSPHSLTAWTQRCYYGGPGCVRSPPPPPGPQRKATESLNYTAALKLRWHLDPWNAFIMWRDVTSGAPAHRRFLQSGGLLTIPAYRTGGGDKGANIARRTSCRANSIKTHEGEWKCGRPQREPTAGAQRQSPRPSQYLGDNAQ